MTIYGHSFTAVWRHQSPPLFLLRPLDVSANPVRPRRRSVGGPADPAHVPADDSGAHRPVPAGDGRQRRGDPGDLQPLSGLPPAAAAAHRPQVTPRAEQRGLILILTYSWVHPLCIKWLFRTRITSYVDIHETNEDANKKSRTATTSQHGRVLMYYVCVGVGGGRGPGVL